MRFFAAVTVLFYHVLAPDAGEGFLQGIGSSGKEAVTFFFILSGFILTYVYSDESSDLKTSVRKFWGARFARLSPAYVVGLVFGLPTFLYSVFFLHSISFEIFTLSLLLVPVFAQAWWPATTFSWNVPAWSVSIEVFFYFLFPILGRTARAFGVVVFLIVSMLLLLLVFDILRAAIWPTPDASSDAWNIMYFPPFHLPYFIFGMALCRLFLFGPAFSQFLTRFLFPSSLIVSLGLLGFRADLSSWVVHYPP